MKFPPKRALFLQICPFLGVPSSHSTQNNMRGHELKHPMRVGAQRLPTNTDEIQPMGPSTVSIVVPALSGFVFAKFLDDTDCGILSCSMAHGGVFIRLFCAAGWTVSVAWEVAVLFTYNLNTWWRKWVPLFSIPLVYMSIFSCTPESMQTFSSVDQEIRCRNALCHFHDIVSLLWGVTEVGLIFLRPKLPSYSGIAWMVVVGVSTIVLNVVRVVNPNTHMIPSSGVSKAFGALEVLVLLSARSAAAESLCV